MMKRKLLWKRGSYEKFFKIRCAIGTGVCTFWYLCNCRWLFCRKQCRRCRTFCDQCGISGGDADAVGGHRNRNGRCGHVDGTACRGTKGGRRRVCAYSTAAAASDEYCIDGCNADLYGSGAVLSGSRGDDPSPGRGISADHGLRDDLSGICDRHCAADP